MSTRSRRLGSSIYSILSRTPSPLRVLSNNQLSLTPKCEISTGRLPLTQHCGVKYTSQLQRHSSARKVQRLFHLRPALFSSDFSSKPPSIIPLEAPASHSTNRETPAAKNLAQDGESKSIADPPKGTYTTAQHSLPNKVANRIHSLKPKIEEIKLKIAPRVELLRSNITPGIKTLASKLSPRINAIKASISPKLEHFHSSITPHYESLSENIKKKSSHLTTFLDTLTGYENITKLKDAVIREEATFKEAQRHLKMRQEIYMEKSSAIMKTQRELNDLLTRKTAWTQDDVSRFPQLFAAEHSLSQEISDATAELRRAETRVDSAYDSLVQSLMQRYHDEQVWSDRIRSISALSTWALVGLNVLIFLITLVVLEPRRLERFTIKIISKLEQLESAIFSTSDAARPIPGAPTPTNIMTRDQAERLIQLLSQGPPPAVPSDAVPPVSAATNETYPVSFLAASTIIGAALSIIIRYMCG